MTDEEVLSMRSDRGAACRRIAASAVAKLRREVRLVPAIKFDRRPRERIVGNALQPLFQLRDRSSSCPANGRAVLRHLLLERGKPRRVGGQVVRKQLVSRAHRRFVS